MAYTQYKIEEPHTDVIKFTTSPHIAGIWSAFGCRVTAVTRSD